MTAAFMARGSSAERRDYGVKARDVPAKNLATL